MKIKINKGTAVLLNAVNRLAMIEAWSAHKYNRNAEDVERANALAELIGTIVGGAAAAAEIPTASPRMRSTSAEARPFTTT